MPTINAKIYYHTASGDVLLTIPEQSGDWLRETSFLEDHATYAELTKVNQSVIGLLKLAPGQHADDFKVSRPVRVEKNQILWQPFGAPIESPPQKSFIERLEALEAFARELGGDL